MSRIVAKCVRSTYPEGGLAIRTKGGLREWVGKMPKSWCKMFGPFWDKSPEANEFYAEVSWPDNSVDVRPVFLQRVEVKEKW